MRGLLDALAIYSFIIAGFLFILISEVADSYYLRALSSLLTFVGMFIGFYFIFKIDAPHLSPSSMGIALIFFILGMAFALAFFILVVGRLILEKVRSTVMVKVVEEGVDVAESVEAPAEAEKVVSVAEAKAVPKILVCIGGPHFGEEFELKQGENFIGRTQGDIILSEDPQVSRSHCVIVVRQFAISIKDLGSTNGTWVNNEKIVERELSASDVITLGQCKFRLK